MSEQHDWKPGAECSNCGKPAREGLMSVGWYCSDECKTVLFEKSVKYEEELLAEPIGNAPDFFRTAGELTRFTHKIALHTLRDISDTNLAKLKKHNPMMLVPSEFGQHIAGLILNHIRDYVEVEEARGHMRMFSGGTYRITKQIPAEVVAEALVKAGVCERKGRAK
jgi:hypothetical protein